MDAQEEINQPSIPTENASPSSPHKRRLVIICGAALLVLFLFSVIIFTKKNNQNVTPLVKVNQQVTPTPNLKTAVSAKWYTIKTQYYAVSVPTGWKPKAEPMQGGVSMLVQPSNAPEQPLLVIESYTTPISIQEKVNVFQAMGLKPQTVKIPNSQPVMLAGTWPTRTLNGKTIKTPTQERVIFIPHGNSIYSVKLYYSSAQPEKVYEDMLQKVLASFISST